MVCSVPNFDGKPKVAYGMLRRITVAARERVARVHPGMSKAAPGARAGGKPPSPGSVM